jgi:DNA polymerase-1
MPVKKLVLVDGSYYLFRAYHAMGDLTNAAGEPTGAIYGVINMVRKMLADYTPDYFAVVFDSGKKTFRAAIYPEYKAHRPPVPVDLIRQIEPLHAILKAQGMPLIVADGVEADDVIATLARRAESAGMATIISTGDKDLAQIVNGSIKLVNTMSETTLDPAGVKQKYGVPPELIIDYLTLIGDTSDNVPGVPKVGPKTAVKWLEQYGSLDAIIRHANEIGGKVGENLRASIPILPLSRQLNTLKTDVPLTVEPFDLICQAPATEDLRAHYQRWGLRSLLNRLDQQAGPAPATPAAAPPLIAVDYRVVLSQEEFHGWCERMRQADLVSIDTETTSLDYMQARIVGFSLCIKPGQAAYIPLAHQYPDVPQQLDLEMVLTTLKPLLESPEIKKVGHNLKYDMHILANHGIALDGIAHDTMLESYVLDSVATRHDMDSLADRYLGLKTTTYEEVAGKGAKQIPFAEVPIATAGHYSAEDADVTLRLHEKFWPELAAADLRDLYLDLELPLLPVLNIMERNGVRIDPEMLARQSDELGDKMRELETQAYRLSGREFNIGSPKQIQEILFDEMQLPVRSKTPGGQPSTAESVLQDLAEEYELPRVILAHRGMSKLRSTYADRLPTQINPATGRIHASFHQAVAATGRLSSSDPNLQNIPVRTEEGRRIRQAFIPAAGCLLLAADYSQIELRIMAHLSGDAGMLQAFASGEDIHRTTASEIFDVPIAAVTQEQRRAAKAINFGLIYGMSAFGLARQLGTDRTRAGAYIEKYFARFPAVRAYMDEIRETARRKGYVETMFHRRLYLPEINSKNPARRQYAERTAINAPMQGTAADIIKKAMIAIHNSLCRNESGLKMIMQVHDELVFEVREDQCEAARAAIREHMENAAALKAPLRVETGLGLNWDEAH